jgi:hypothetical protein
MAFCADEIPGLKGETWGTRRLHEEGSQLVTNCHQLKLPASDGKSYLTDVANAETLLRLVQSVPSPKAEPIKLWLAKVGYERDFVNLTWPLLTVSLAPPKGMCSVIPCWPWRKEPVGRLEPRPTRGGAAPVVRRP